LAGSYWVIALCVASAIEGLVKLDPAFESALAEFTGAELDPLKTFVATVTPERIRGRLSGWLAGLHQPSASRFLCKLQQDGRVTRAQLDAWKKVRNQVAHGNLFEPWGTREKNEQLVALVNLFYRLTAQRIGFDKSAPC